MFLYNLYGFEENRVFQHTKEFTLDEFERMCKEVDYNDCYGYYLIKLEDHLVNYGFERAIYTAGFDVDVDIED